MARILPAFSIHSEEGRLIGEMVVGYGELEILLAHLVGEITSNRDVAFKVMFRARGEEQRVILADALARPILPAGPYRDFFERTIAAQRHCLRIRNQYAHAVWGYDGRGLWFVALEEVAKDNAPYDLTSLTQKLLPLALLKEQWAYFVFTKTCLEYLNFERQLEAGKITASPVPKPPGMPAPPLA